MPDEKTRRRLLGFVVGIAGLFTVGALDWLTGYQISISIFYLIPILIGTRWAGRNVGLALSVVAAVFWYLAEVFTPGHYVFDHPAIPVWNAIMRLAIFFIVTSLVARLQTAVATEEQYARHDYLTGAANSRHFYEILGIELERLHRTMTPLSLAYLDIDDFKFVNDKHGHKKGDSVLRRATLILKRHMRGRDVVARLGGDEFALLMPEAGSEGALAAIKRIQQAFNEEMASEDLPATFSVGVVTFVALPRSPDEMIHLADHLMYEVKKCGKNNVKSLVYDGASSNSLPSVT